MNTPPLLERARPKLRLRFSLRALLALILIVAAFFGGWASRNREVERLREELVMFREGALAERRAAEAAAAEFMRMSSRKESAAQDDPRDQPPQAKSADAAEDQDQRFRRRVVGNWEDDYEGKRTMTLRDDGTGTMVVELAGLKAALFAPRLQFEMVWSVDSGRLKKQTLKGEPEVQVQLILKTMGDRVDEQILELTDERLLLLDQNGQTKYDWRRVRGRTTDPASE